MANVAHMLTQEPIYKPSSIFCFKSILLSAHKLTLLIYGDNKLMVMLMLMLVWQMKRRRDLRMLLRSPQVEGWCHRLLRGEELQASQSPRVVTRSRRRSKCSLHPYKFLLCCPHLLIVFCLIQDWG